jgi:hypothetical protein
MVEDDLMLGSRELPNPTPLTVASLHIYPIKAVVA